MQNKDQIAIHPLKKMKALLELYKHEDSRVWIKVRTPSHTPQAF